VRHAFVALTLSFMAIAPCGAQGVPCGRDVFTYTIFEFAPTTPSSQPVTFTAGYYNALSTGATATVHGNVIDVTIDGLLEIVPGLPPPMYCFSATVGPLPVGTYTVNLIGIFFRSSSLPPVLLATKPLSVTAAIAPAGSPIPTLSEAGIAAMALLMSIVGWFALRRRP
jgi:hypothetical protein